MVGAVEDEGEGEFLIMGEVPFVEETEVGWQGAVGGGDSTNPLATFPLEMDVEGLRLVDVTCPEQADVAVGKGLCPRDAFEGQLEGSVLQEFVALAGFQLPVRGRGLVEFDGVFVDDPQFHGCPSWFEQGIPALHCPVVDMLKVQPCVIRDKEVPSVLFVFQGRYPAIPSTVTWEDAVIDGLVVHDDGFDIAAFEDGVGLFWDFIAKGVVAEGSEAGQFCQRAHRQDG